jgi:hypothetical protein
MKSNTLMPLFNQLFDPVQTTTESPQVKAILQTIRARQELPEVECEIINGRPRAKLNRDQADVVAELVNQGRAVAQQSDKWTQSNLDMWDQYWLGTDNSNGIEHTLTNYHMPNVTLKQLLWCVNSITKTQTSKAVPGFVREAVRTLRAMEKETE